MLMRLVLSAHLSSTTSLPWTHAAITWELDNMLMPSPRIWPQVSPTGRSASAGSEGKASSLWNFSAGQDVHVIVTRTCGPATYTHGCGCVRSVSAARQEEENSICKAHDSREGHLGCPLSAHQPGSCGPN
uniref:Potassium inwardly rectifying channel subfamily J member 1 n=1 Tax=Rhinopithecus bieti TaxID=61621 RepID=A0A2K6M8L6_RHIBE